MGASNRIVSAREDGTPLLIVASRNVGMRHAFYTLAFMAAWDVARSRLRKREITLQEYAEYWKVTQSTSFREQRRFRKAFPGETTPDALLDAAAAQWDQATGVKGLGALKLAT